MQIIDELRKQTTKEELDALLNWPTEALAILTVFYKVYGAHKKHLEKTYGLEISVSARLQNPRAMFESTPLYGELPTA